MVVWAIFTLLIDKKEEEKLEYIFCILYLMTFEDQVETKILFNLRSKVNIISQAFALQLGLKIQKTNIKA